MYKVELRGSLTALGFAILGVNVFALTDISDDLADVLAILRGGVTRFEIGQRYLVPDWHVVLGCQAEGRIVVRDAAQHVSASGQTFDHDDADVISLFMHE